MDLKRGLQCEEELSSIRTENKDLRQKHRQDSGSDIKDDSSAYAHLRIFPCNIKDENITEKQPDGIALLNSKNIKEGVSSYEYKITQQSSTVGAMISQKSENQITDNTSSPCESQSSTRSGVSPEIPLRHNPSVVIVPLKTVTNGVMPKSGKPFMSSFNPKLNKPRGRPKRNKALVAMYQSEISDNKVGIKLCIKKSDTLQSKREMSKKRSKKSKYKQNADSDDSEYDKRRRKEKSNNNTDRQRKAERGYKEPEKQGVWGESLPENVLYKVFQILVQQEGCLPTLCRLGRVCNLWRSVSLVPTLWMSLDLSASIKEKYHTEDKLKWFIASRMSKCKELNISNWKIADVQCVLERLADACPELVGINLSGWKGLTSDNLMYLVENLHKLERLDLSSINTELENEKNQPSTPQYMTYAKPNDCNGPLSSSKIFSLRSGVLLRLRNLKVPLYLRQLHEQMNSGVLTLFTELNDRNRAFEMSTGFVVKPMHPNYIVNTFYQPQGPQYIEPASIHEID